MDAINKLVGGPIGNIGNMFLQGILTQGLRNEVPKPIDLSRTYGSGSYSPTLPINTGGNYASPDVISQLLKHKFNRAFPAGATDLGVDAVPGLEGTSITMPGGIPEGGGLAIDQIVADYAAQIDKRRQEEEAMGFFGDKWGGALSDMKRIGRGGLDFAGMAGRKAFRGARAGLQDAANVSGDMMRKGIGELIADAETTKAEYYKSIEDVKGLVGQFREEQNLRTAEMLGDYIGGRKLQMEQMEADLSSRMNAVGGYTPANQSVVEQAKSAMGNDILATAGVMRLKRYNEADAQVAGIYGKVADTMMTGYRAFTDFLGITAGAKAGLRDSHAQRITDIAESHRKLGEAEAKFEADIAYGKVQNEAQIANFTFQGASILAEMHKNLTIPIVQGAYDVVTDFMTFNFSVASHMQGEFRDWYAQRAGLTQSDKQDVSNMFGTAGEMREADEQRDHEMAMLDKKNEAQMWSSGMEMVGNAIPSNITMNS